MPSITLTNALQAVFGTTKTTGSYVPLATSAGGPDGIISMANLASVLGGLRIVTNITDLNAVDYSCASTINGATVSNSPLNGWGSFISIKGNSYTSQLFIAGSNNALFYRNTNTGAWVRSYDSTMLTSPDLLSPLASALGAFANKRSIDSTYDMNNFKMETGIVYNTSLGSAPINAPRSSLAGFYISLIVGDTFSVQVCFSRDGDGAWWRVWNGFNSVWTNWREM